MKNFIKNSFRKISFTSAIIELYFFQKKFLKEKGWFRSAFLRSPVDRHGTAIPWFSYPAISFLNDRVTSAHDVFEFGSGNSTIWFSKKVRKIISLEHDPDFYNKMKGEISAGNVEYILKPLANKEYENYILNCNSKFDVIIIDGRERVQTAKNSMNFLKEDGVIIWDNSDRQKYQEGYKFLIDNGFKRLDFLGIAPGLHAETCTSIFYREQNCFGI